MFDSSQMKLPKPSLAAFAESRAFQIDGYEVFEDFIYDKVTYLAAGSASLDVFTTQSNDETITNLKQPGQIPKPDKFHAYKLFLIPLVEVATDTDGTAADRPRDVSRILYGNRGVLKLTPSTTGRTRTGIPLWAIGQPNPMVASGWGSSAVANSRAIGTNGAVGFPFEIALDSTEELRGQLKFGNAQAISADLDLVIALYGWRYKKAG